MHSTSTSLSESHHIDQLVPFKKSTLHRRVDVATNDGDCDHHVQDAGELVAAAHVADRHKVGIDHTGQLGAWARLEDDAHSDQSMQSTLFSGGGDHVDSSHGATFMKLTLDSDVGLTSPSKSAQPLSCPCRDKRPIRLPSASAKVMASFVFYPDLSGRPRR